MMTNTATATAAAVAATPDTATPSCPTCGGRMWDNRASKRNPKAPDFKCRSRACDGVIWPPRPALVFITNPAGGEPMARSRVSEPGMYRNAAGALFKVQESGTGNLYAKALTPIGGARLTETDAVVRWEFTYAPGAMRELCAEDRLPLDDARAFGIRYGVCCVCGRTLKDAASVAAGIGPVCVTKV
jgi:hypothetical protein